MEKFTIIGFGNCGSQITSLAEELYPEIFDGLYINTSSADLAMIKGKGPQFKISSEDEEFEDEIQGTGKDRTLMKNYLVSNIKNLIQDETFADRIDSNKYCFIISSMAGGTGSGGSPALMNVLQQFFPDIKFIIIGVLPAMAASRNEFTNTLQYLEELLRIKTDDDGNLVGVPKTYMIYDNNQEFGKSPTDRLSMINNEIVEDLRILSGVDSFATPYESIDNADLASILTTPGRLIVSRIKGTITEKNMEDSYLDELIIKSIKHSAHCETDRNKECGRWGVITYFTEEVNKLYNNEFTKLKDFIGEPIERFNHNAINPGSEEQNFIYVIASGLSPINDKAEKINIRKNELTDSLAKTRGNQYIFANDSVADDDMHRRTAGKKKVDAKIDLTDIIMGT